MAALTARMLPRCGAPASTSRPRASALSHAPQLRSCQRQAPCWRAAPALRSAPRTQPRGRAPVRPPRAAIAAPAAAVAAAGQTLLQTLASLLGMAMGAGSLLLYSPIVLRLWRTRKAEGMALSTWALQLFGFTAGVLYNATKGFPLTAYAETLSFTVQVRGAACDVLRCVVLAHLARALSSPRLGSRQHPRPPGALTRPFCRRAPPSWSWWRTCSGGCAPPPSPQAAPYTCASARQACLACRPGRCPCCSWRPR